MARGHEHEEHLVKHLTIDTHKKSTVVSVFDMNIKSHKGDGFVVPRPIHSSVGHAFSGGMRYIAYLIRRKLSSCHHLIRDSDDFINKLSSLSVGSGTYVVKIDVKEFFMGGDIPELAHLIQFAFNERDRVALTKLAAHILRNQFIRSGRSKKLHRVVKGTGMGLIFSGEVADFIMYYLLEMSFLLLPAVQAKFSIKVFFWFKDDLLLFVDGPRWSLDALLRVMQVKSSFFRLSLDSCSQDSARFLDLEISKGCTWRTTGRLDYKVVVKDTHTHTHLGIVLDDSSTHPNSVHKTWPVSISNRIAFRSSTSSACESSQNSFVAKFDRDCPDHAVLPALKSLQLFQRPLVRYGGEPLPKCNSWIIVPFHPVWHAAKLGAKLFRIHEKWQSTLSFFVTNFRSGISWSLGGRHHFRVLKLINT